MYVVHQIFVYSLFVLLSLVTKLQWLSYAMPHLREPRSLQDRASLVPMSSQMSPIISASAVTDKAEIRKAQFLAVGKAREAIF